MHKEHSAAGAAVVTYDLAIKSTQATIDLLKHDSHFLCCQRLRSRTVSVHCSVCKWPHHPPRGLAQLHHSCHSEARPQGTTGSHSCWSLHSGLPQHQERPTHNHHHLWFQDKAPVLTLVIGMLQAAAARCSGVFPLLSRESTGQSMPLNRSMQTLHWPLAELCTSRLPALSQTQSQSGRPALMRARMTLSSVARAALQAWMQKSCLKARLPAPRTAPPHWNRRFNG